MSSKKDLVARANAALALGDWFVPPEGTTVCWRDGQRIGTVVSGSSCATEIKIRTEFTWADGAPGVGDLWISHGVHLFEIVDFGYIEGEIPPFEHWTRPGGRGSHDELIALANSALRLGDWFFPPVGSVIEIRGWGMADVISDVWVTSPDGELYVDGCCAVMIGVEPTAVSLAPGSDYTISRLPPDTPPFDQWYRPRRLEW